MNAIWEHESDPKIKFTPAKSRRQCLQASKTYTERGPALAASKAPPWEKALDALGEYDEAMQSKDKTRARQTLNNLRHILHSGADAATHTEYLWGEIQELINLKGKTAYTAHRRLVDLLGLRGDHIANKCRRRSSYCHCDQKKTPERRGERSR
jgi:hypothetical protein